MPTVRRSSVVRRTRKVTAPKLRRTRTRIAKVTRAMPASNFSPAPAPAPASRPSLGRSILSGGGGAIGAGLGSLLGPAGSRFGQRLGSFLGNGLSTIFGMGAYDIKHNSLMSGEGYSSQVPAMHDGSENVRVRHREFIGDIYTSATAGKFNLTQYPLQPGLDSSFPWLSGLAQQFQEYSFEGIAYEFKSDSADALNSTNTALGAVMMSTTYRAGTSIAITNKVEMLNEAYSVECKPSENAIMFVECDPAQTVGNGKFYVRGSSVPSGEDIKTYDMATINVATVNMQGTSVNVGELWVTYDIVLSKPISLTQQGQYLNTAHYGQTSTLTATSANPFAGLSASSSVTTTGDGIGLTVGNNSITFPLGSVGKYMISYWCVGSSASLVPGSWSYVNCSAESCFAGNANPGANTPSISTTTFLTDTMVSISDSTKQASMTWSGQTLPTSITAVDLFVTQMNNTSV